MKKSRRFVLDTNVLVSVAIFPLSIPGQALDNEDLLVLHPLKGIPIIAPLKFISEY
jgi:predicted nucleic acid-binding protein